MCCHSSFEQSSETVTFKKLDCFPVNKVVHMHAACFLFSLFPSSRLQDPSSPRNLLTVAIRCTNIYLYALVRRHAFNELLVQTDVSVCCAHTARDPQEQVTQESVVTCTEWHLHVQILKVDKKSDANMSIMQR